MLNLEIYNEYHQPIPSRARLTRRLIIDLVCIVIFEIEYSIAFLAGIQH